MKRKKIEIGDNLMMLLIVVVMVAGIVLGSVVKCKGQGQTDSTETYCLPLWIARQEIENSSKKIEQDSLIVSLNMRLVEKHLVYQVLQEDFAIYRANTDGIIAGYRKENAGLVTINTRLATDNEKLTFVKIPLLGNVKRKDVNFVMKVALFGAGVMVGK